MDGPERPESDTAERLSPEWPWGSWRLRSPRVLVAGPVLGWRVGSWGEANDAGGLILVDCRRGLRVDGVDGPGADSVATSRALPEAVDGPGSDDKGGLQDSPEVVVDGRGEKIPARDTQGTLCPPYVCD